MVDFNIVMENVTFTYKYGEVPAIKNINLKVREGEKILVTGPAGAGKTTLCRCLNGLIPYHFNGEFKGKVTVQGLNTRKYDVGDLSPMVGLSFQNPLDQIVCSSVMDEIAFGPENLGLPEEVINERVQEYLEMARLTGYEDTNPLSLSGGQQQSCCIAAIIAMHPKILVLDEPTANLDNVGTRLVHSMIDKLVRSEKITLVIVSHRLRELATMIDRMVVLRNGKIMLEGEPRRVLKESEKLYEVGLFPPEITRLALKLRDAGINAFINGLVPVTVEEGYKAILHGMKSKALIPSAPRVVHRKEKRRARLGEQPIIETQDLGHVYPGNVVALKNLSLKIYPGEFLAIIGQNGSGKTTLIKHFNGLLEPTQGTVYVKGIDTKTTTTSRLARIVGFIYQNPDDQMVSFRVKEEVEYGPKNLGFSKTEAEKLALDALKMVGMEQKIESLIFELSQGERQRVAIASVLAMKPGVLVVDEPTTGQDPATSLQIFKLLEKLNESGSTIVIVTHNMNLVAGFAERVFVLKDGEMILDGDTQSVYSKPEILQKTAQEPPEMMKLGQMLKDYNVPTWISNVDEMYNFLLHLLKGGD